jgi:hypothetical protein
MDRSTLSPDFRTNGRSPEVSSTAFRTQPPSLQPVPLMDGLRGHLPARPAPYASDPVLVHRLVRLLRASFRPSVAGTPLRFAMTSPPSGCQGDFHPRAVEHARHTKQRAALARALIWNPRLLLCDEPTGNLDEASADMVATLLLNLHSRKESTLIVVTHSAALAARFPRRYELRHANLQPASA